MAGIRPSDIRIKRPAELDDAHWQKKKGKIGKLVKTGIGAELKKLNLLIKKIDLMVLDPSSNPSKTMAELRDKVVAAKKEYAKSIPPLQKQCKAVQAIALKAEATLKKKPFGKDAAKAAAAVAKAADWYSVTCKSLDLDKAIADVKAAIDKKNAIAAKLLEGSIKKFLTGAKKYLALDNPTKDDWDAIMKQNGRSVSNSVAQLTEYRDRFWKDFVKFKGFDLNTMGIKDDEKFAAITKKLVKMSAAQVVAIAKFKPS